MRRLFSGTPWDRPPTCERCGQPESECRCPIIAPARVPLAPESQTARLRLEKRSKGKVVTLLSNLDPDGTDLPALAAALKSRVGAGGTVKEGVIELQGDRLDAVEAVLKAIGYKCRRA